MAAVAVHAGWGLLGRAGGAGTSPAAGSSTLLGAIAAATVGPWLVLVLLGCGLIELLMQRRGMRDCASGRSQRRPPAGCSPLSWVAFKVGALSYGGGFVIVPLMQARRGRPLPLADATQFVNAVALGQITPGPVVHTVAAVGYGAAGLGGGLLAALVAFSPSFAFVLARRRPL